MTTHLATNDGARRALIALSLVPGLGPTTLHRLLKMCPNPEQLLDSPQSVSTTGRDQAMLTKIADARRKVISDADTQMQRAAELGISIITHVDAVYPANLIGAPDAPPVLYVKGRLMPGDELSVAVVGARDASPAGLERARRVAELLTAKGVAVVSGLARGIDTAAHQAALDRLGRTIAVVGCGLDRTYPAENARLARDIADCGAVISQFPIGTPPHAQNFPMRNKTMALLSLATVVVEASPVSGAKMQADFALKTDSPKRFVFLMKSLIDSQPETGWPHEFLQRGAQPMEHVEDLLRVLHVPMSGARQLALF